MNNILVFKHYNTVISVINEIKNKVPLGIFKQLEEQKHMMGRLSKNTTFKSGRILVQIYLEYLSGNTISWPQV